MKKRFSMLLLVLIMVMCGLFSLTFLSAAAGETFQVTVKAAAGGKVSTDGTNWSDSVVVSIANGATLGDSVKYKPDEGYKLDGVIASTILKKVVASALNTAVIDNAGNLYTAGDNERGQLGRKLGSYIYEDSVLTKVDTSAKITDVAMGAKHLVVLDENGDVWTAGANPYGELGTDVNVGKSYGENATLTKVTVGDGSVKIKAVAAGQYHTILIDENGGVWTAGLNSSGQLGRSNNVGNSTQNAVFQKVDGLDAVKIVSAAGGAAHTILLDEDGNVWTAGTSNYNVLGRQTEGTPNKVTSNPTFEKVTDGISGVKITAIAAGSYHNVLLDENGNVWTVGSNLYGELGRKPLQSSSSVFEKADLQGAAAAKFIAAYGSATVVIDTDGYARTCGIHSGHLGRPVTESSPELLKATNGIDNIKMVAAAMGTYHTVLLDENGGIWSCGKNQCGQLCRTENFSKYTSVTTFAAATDGLIQTISFDEMKNLIITSDRMFTITSAAREKVQLEYDLNGGEWVDGFTPPSFAYTDEGLSLPDASKLKKPGYTFAGWETSSLPANPIKCSAKWTANIYTVTFDTNGGEMTTRTMTVTYGEELDQMPIPIRMGYVFDGWCDKKEGGRYYSDKNGNSITTYDKTEDCTLYAMWTEGSCMITLDANGGTLTGAATRKVKQNGPMVEPAAPTREGYTFIGWYKDAACTQIWNFPMDWVTHDMTLYAGWYINAYTITINPENGGETITITEYYGAPVTAPLLTKTGYLFAGWDQEFPTTMPAGNLTITALWTVCDHADSTAKPTCTDPATCTTCGGTIAALGHDFSKQEQDADRHWKKCSRCDATDDAMPHDWDSGVTTTPSTCMRAGEKIFTCTKCGATKIDPIPANGHNWEQAWRYDATHHWHECLNDNCDVKDHDSQKYGYAAHTGGEATCTAPAVCDLCHQPYGEENPGNHKGGTTEWTTKTATNHEKKWSCCGTVVVASEAHAWADGVCSECGYACLHDDTDQNHICDYCSKVISSHTGGTATCTEQAICDICHRKYGDVRGHSYGAPLYNWNGTHCTAERVCANDASHTESETVIAQVTVTQKRTCTSAELSTYTATFQNPAFSVQTKEQVRTAAPLGHNFAIWQHNATYHWNKCTRCNATSSNVRHSGGTATCTEQAVCKFCKTTYGALDLTHHTGTADWTKTATTHEQVWSCCGLVICKKGPHRWRDGICLDCANACSHTGGAATCHTKAICDICRSAYGAFDNTHHAGGTDVRDAKTQSCAENGYTGDTYCKGCKERLASGTIIQADGHKGGTATCTEAAICDVCHEKYGALDANHHFRLATVEEIPATAANTGTCAHWYCTACGKRFADADGKNEISLADTVLKKLAPSILEGANGKWTKGTGNDLSFRSDAAFSDFVEVLVDGNAIPADRYTKSEGSICVALKASYLATLTEGEHTLTIRSASGDATTTFTVDAAIVSPPENSAPVWVWILLAVLVLCIGTTVVVIVIRKKKAA